MNNITLPTFDEWYEAKYLQSFDAEWVTPMTPIGTAMRALTVAMRGYITEMAKLAVTPHSKDDPKTPADRQGFEPFTYTERS